VLTIRNEQVVAFAKALRKSFEDRLTSHIAAEYPKQYEGWGEQGTRRLVLAGIDKAAAHGIAAEGAVAVLIELMVETGSGFERSPDRKWVHNILAHPALPGDAKVDAIQKRIRSRTQGRTIVLHNRRAG
jgi:hypothetical protein